MERDTITGCMRPVEDRPRLRPVHGVLALALVSLLFSAPSAARAAFGFGLVLGEVLL